MFDCKTCVTECDYVWSTVCFYLFCNIAFSMKLSGGKPFCVGSCRLHMLLNAFKCNFIAWQLDNLLRALHTLFHNVPARREDHITVTKPSASVLIIGWKSYLLWREPVWLFLLLYSQKQKKFLFFLFICLWWPGIYRHIDQRNDHPLI